MADEKNLEFYRDEILNVDREIIALMRKRKELVREIGLFKSSHDLELRDFVQEKRVMENAMKAADEFRVSRRPVKDIVSRLIEYSLAVQEKSQVKAKGKGSGRKALVIGGLGKIGVWFSRFLESQGFEVFIADTGVETESRILKNNWTAFDHSFDVTVVAVPLGHSAGVLLELAEHKMDGLIFDVASLKTPVQDALYQLRDAGCKVTSVHPMFGADTEMLGGKHVIFMDVGNCEALNEARDLFRATMATCVEMTLDEHDKLVAFVLGLSHLLNIAFFTALSNSGEEIKRLHEISSTSFDSQLEVAQKISAENPHLYFEIQRLNRYRHLSQKSLTNALTEIIHTIESNNESNFVQYMTKGREYLKTLPYVKKSDNN
ncbi:MAG: bifunctional chorismate mutase/prephenate dehydrogenase [Deltaproteobacteria bacterium]|nr:bifunctional chorismate mutase/prephenate dehydrogenase [Deltaproteobacteria bacterium]